MKILLYLLVPVLVVATFATISWVRNRQPTSLESGVDAFKREMSALSPEAAPIRRRRPDGGPDTRPPVQRQPPRRPPNAGGPG